jgi:hypothetical protein
MLKNSRQEVVEKALGDLVKSQVELSSTDFERQPSPIAVAQLVALGAGIAAVAHLSASQLLELAVKLLNRRRPGQQVLNGLRLDWVWGMGEEPVNVAVWGDYLEQLAAKGQFLEFDSDAIFQALGCPVHGLKVEIAFVFAEGNRAVVFDGRDEAHLPEGTQFQVVHTGVPAIKQDRLGLDLRCLAVSSMSPNRSFLVRPSMLRA